MPRGLLSDMDEQQMMLARVLMSPAAAPAPMRDYLLRPEPVVPPGAASVGMPGTLPFSPVDTTDPAAQMMLRAGVGQTEADTARMWRQAQMATDFTGGIRAFHGSPRVDLRQILPDPPARQYDNATSQLGAFFAPKEAQARHYAGASGRIYETELDLRKPYEMEWSDFNRLQSPNLGANGERLPGEQWAARAAELRTEAAALRERLAAQGYDGVIVRRSNGDIFEMSSFAPVDVGGLLDQ